ncbi:hypothetical protein JMJ55_21105 [Belnapia sp. T6]|uniref:Uncharacterized protein n=1 Tax=Belnapia mucosa TaxID=2804532 RepID=A0ABS1V836_9PROT|nr:hypothetical protein [Belnapia mucosa]MBL6457841.1 hypothetical protein [Belnapia mucosa]
MTVSGGAVLAATGQALPATHCQLVDSVKQSAEVGLSDRGKLSASELTEELCSELTKAASAYGQTDDPDLRRDAALDQLMRIASYLPHLGIPHDALRPMTAIIHAIADIDRGTVPRILKRIRRVSDQRIPFEHLAQRGIAAAAVTLYYEADNEQGSDEKRLDRALKKVAIRIRNWPAVTQRSSKRNGPQSMVEPLRDWRNAAMAGGSEDLDHTKYIAALQTRPKDVHSPASWAEWLLTHGVKLYL